MRILPLRLCVRVRRAREINSPYALFPACRVPRAQEAIRAPLPVSLTREGWKRESDDMTPSSKSERPLNHHHALPPTFTE